MSVLRHILSGLGAALLHASATQADLVSPYGGETAPNFAELIVMEDRVRVVLEIDRADFPIFVAAEDGTGTGLSARTGRTLRVEADGRALAPVTRVVDLRPRKTRLTAATATVAPRPRSAEVIYAELDYPFDARPASVTFIPPLDAKGLPRASIGMLAEHGGVAVTDYRYLSQPETLRLDWEDPWFSRFENPNLKRHHASPLMSFVTVDPREVRHELILRLSDLEEWVDLGLGASDTLDVEAMAAVAEGARAFLADRNPLSIDGVAVAPAEVQVSRIAVGVEGLRVLDPEATTPRRTTLLGVILSYPQPALPGEVAMTWDLFPQGLDSVPVTLADPAGGVPAQARTDDPTVVWTNYLTDWEEPAVSAVTVDAHREIGVPFLSVLLLGLGGVSAVRSVRSSARRRWTGLALLAGVAAIGTVQVAVLPVSLPAGSPDDQAATAISDAMVRNAATAMLETQPESFEAALGSFVSAPEIGSVGAEMRRGLSVVLPSGARARTDTIEGMTIEEITSQGDDLSLLASWTAQVSGGHWGHMHRRDIRYRALMEVEETDGAWMLQGLTVLSVKVGA